jgi:hypothetical protein
MEPGTLFDKLLHLVCSAKGAGRFAAIVGALACFMSGEASAKNNGV